MKVLRLHGPRDLRLEEEALPVPRPDEELVRVTAVGICGSDLHWYEECGIGDSVLTRPLVLGHEGAGEIVSGPRAGRRVAIDPAIPCHACEECHAGRQHLCLNLRFAGDGATDGLFRELAAWPSASLIPIPETIGDVDAAMLEPLGIALHAVRLGRLGPGMRVGIFGCGPIGLFLVQLARASGATTIVATDVLPHRVEAATGCGATRATVVDGGRERIELLAETDGHGVDVAFEAAGNDDALETSLVLAARAATVVVVGIPGNDRMTMPASIARRKALTIRLSRRMNRVYPEAIRLVEAGLVDVRSVVSGTYPIESFGEAFSTAARREGLKIVVQPAAPASPPPGPLRGPVEQFPSRSSSDLT